MRRSFVALALRRRLTLLAGIAVALALLAGNFQVASAHNWKSYHWHKSGNAITFKHYNTAYNRTAAERARQDGWNKISILYNYSVDYHTDVHVYDAHFWNQTWVGLATIQSVAWDGGTWSYSHITHAHAIYNRRYGDSNQARIQGVFCQEIFHAYGFDHSNTGDCMGLGYYNNIYYYGPHNNTDFYNRYINHR